VASRLIPDDRDLNNSTISIDHLSPPFPHCFLVQFSSSRESTNTMSEVRHRTSAKRPEPVAMTPAARAKEEDSTITLLDICRGVVFVVLISSALSWFVTRDSLVWNIQRPAFTRLDVIKIWIVSIYT
jgi:hypothetical protein